MVFANKRNKGFFYFFVFIVSAFLFLNISAIAAPDSESEGLTISPPISELSLKEGEKEEKTIKITNPTGKTIEVYPKVMDFKAKGEGGEPLFYSANDEDSKFSLSKWISFTQPKIALTPQQVVDFKYTIDVPISAEPGGHYGVMFFASEPPESEANTSNVTLSSMVGSLLLVKVPGEVTENGAIESFGANKFFYFINNVDFTTRIRNLGNIHFKPKGEIIIKSIFGSEVDRLTVNEQNGNVLPDSVRKFDNKWQSKKLLAGLYMAKVHMVYGDSNKAFDRSLKIMIVPWWMLIIIAFLLLAVFTFLVMVIRKIKRKRKAKRSQNTPPQNPHNNNSGGKIILR